MSFPFYNASNGSMVWDVAMGKGADHFKAMNALAGAFGLQSPAVDFDVYGEAYIDPDRMGTLLRAMMAEATTDPVFWELCQWSLRHYHQTQTLAFE